MEYTKLFILQEMRPQPSNTSGLRFISGIICKSKALRFERMLFRATRGNMFFNQAPAGEQIMDPVTTEMVFFFLTTLWRSFGSFSILSICIYHFVLLHSQLVYIPMLYPVYTVIQTPVIFFSDWENSVRCVFLWGTGKNKDSENLWGIWCELLSCSWRYK